MDNEQKTPSAETLRQMTYSELKKIAKQRGIKGNLKAEKLITAIISMDSDDADSFSTPAAKIINSSRKKKLDKFDEDNMTPLVTPRRGTYSVGSPISLKLDKALPCSEVNALSDLNVSNVTVDKGSERKRRSCRLNGISPFPSNKELSILDMSNVTVGRGSERKPSNRNQSEISHPNESSILDISVTANVANESSVLDMSNVTVGRGSERKSRIRKVSFLSPVMTPHTPRNSNIKMRPKTPIVARTPLTAAVSPSPMKELKVNLGERVDISLHLTPFHGKHSESDMKSTSLLIKDALSDKKKSVSTPRSLLLNDALSAKKKSVSTPKLTRSFVNKNELSKKKRLATPNFKRIREKAFEKMESIDDYQKRLVNSAKKMGVLNSKLNKASKAKTKIPAFGGIPFIPSVSKTDTTKWDSSIKMNKNKQVEENRKPKKKDNENVNKKSKTKFDLKASLSRKLGYKPYTGPLRPLTPSTILNTSAACDHKSKNAPAKEPVNKVVTSNRMQNRTVLKGVRTNKRFELQMKNRMITE